MKYIKRFATVVYIDANSPEALELLPKKYHTKKKFYPYIYFTDNSLKKEFAFIEYPALKNQEYAKILKDVKNDIKQAEKDGTLHSGATPEKDKSEAHNPSIVKIEHSKITDWTSTKGSTIQARLTEHKTTDNTFKFILKTGKSVTVNANDLDAASLKKAKKMVEAN